MPLKPLCQLLSVWKTIPRISRWLLCIRAGVRPSTTLFQRRGAVSNMVLLTCVEKHAKASTGTNEWLWQWPLFSYNKLKQGITSRTRCETSSCNESQHFGRCYSFLRPLDGYSMNHFKKLRVMNLFPIQLGLKLHCSERFTSPSLPCMFSIL